MKRIAMGSKGSLARVLLCTVAPFALFQTASIATAQDAIEDDADLTVVVTASRTEESISSIPGTVQVIGQDELKGAVDASGDITSALERLVPGFSLDNETLSGGGQNFRGRSVQILVNGAPRTTALRKLSRALSLIDPNSIERIEVINGASAVYGDGATGGVINIITKTAEKEGWSGEVSTTVSASERDVKDSLNVLTSVSAAFRQENTHVQVNGQFKNTGDMFDGSGTQISEDPITGQGGGSGIEQYNLSGQVGYEGDAFDVTLYANLVKMEQDIKYQTDYTSDPVSIDPSNPYLGLPPLEDSKNINATFNFYEVGGLFDAKVELYYNDAEKRAAYVPLSAANPVAYLPDVNESQTVLFAKQAGVRTTFDADLSTVYEGLAFTWGSDYSYNDITQTVPDGRDIISPMKQHGFAQFAQVKAPIGEMFEVRGGVRHERFFLSMDSFVRPNALVPNPFYRDGNGQARILTLGEHTFTGAKKDYSATVFNLGAVAHLTDKVDVFAGFSQGFSVPDVGSFTRRAMPVPVDPENPVPSDLTNARMIDVSDVAPEAVIVNNYELGARFNTNGISFAASAFYSTSDKGVNFDDATQTVTQAEERIWGAELNIRGQLSEAWGAGAVLAYKEGVWDENKDGDVDEDLPNNRIGSPFKATVFSDYNFGNGLSVQGEAVFGSGRNGKEGAKGDLKKLKPTFTMNASAGYNSDYGDFHFGVSNIFDTKQQNTTATALRDREVLAEGRRVFLQYTKTF
ncbi:iron complex outermembrane recepter protein [Pseudovibrio ascidiaceicola]|uniref:Iron complex outermembrane recepter protein n=1 Tax=Pseudovibrio ascidiaceicola TaxID=285279 RepID=A0A1I4CKY2_9HYPH|nr:TonB-dependent receptor [Pseudovibrio ascidiaceicola]SFK81942.1 iron complex outermembrane recepter protein [Pseudovibrio ascidiaceicola]